MTVVPLKRRRASVPRRAGRRAEAGREEQRQPARGAMRSGIEERVNAGRT